jgi:hypothetical protein
MSVDLWREIEAMRARIGRLEALDRLFSEEGTWTPALGFAGGGSATYTTQSGYYVRLGNVVLWRALIVLSGVSGPPSGNVVIDSFPFTATQRGGGWAIQYDAINLSAGYTQLGALMLSGAASLLLRENGDNVSAVTVQGGAISAATVLEMAGIAYV